MDLQCDKVNRMAGARHHHFGLKHLHFDWRRIIQIIRSFIVVSTKTNFNLFTTNSADLFRQVKISAIIYRLNYDPQLIYFQIRSAESITAI